MAASSGAPVTDSLRYLLVAALTALALVALGTAGSFALARVRAARRAPLASALTTGLVALALASGLGAVAVATRRAALGEAAAIIGMVAAVAILRVGVLRREHLALVGGALAVGEAQAGLRATLRALAASSRLSERLAAATDDATILSLVVGAARRALPDATISLRRAGEIDASASEAMDAVVALRVDGDRLLCATLTTTHSPRSASGARTVLRSLAAQAQLASWRVADQHTAVMIDRRRALQRSLETRLASVDDTFGAFRLCAETATVEVGAAWAELVSDAGGSHHFAVDDAATRVGTELILPLQANHGVLRVGFVTPPDGDQITLAEAVTDALSRALGEIEWRRVADQRRMRQAAIAQAAAVDSRDPSGAQAILAIARSAFAGDAAIAYAVRDGVPVAIESIGIEPPETADGVASQALAASRTVLDADGAFLREAPLVGIVGALAAPTPGRAAAGAVSVLYRDRPDLRPEDGDDLRAFSQLVFLAVERARLQRELERRELLRIGVDEINDSLAGSREPAETYAAVAHAAASALRAAGAVVVAGVEDLELCAAQPALSGLVDEAGRGGALITLAAREGRVVLCADIASDLRVPAAERRRLVDAGSRSALCVPLTGRDDARVVVGVTWPEPHVASDDDLQLARQLAAASSAAIERAEVLAAERRGRARAQELQRISGLMASNLDAPAVLREIVSQAALLLDADSCVLRLVEGDQLVVRAVQGEAAEILAGTQTPLSGGPTGEVLARRSLVAVADMASDDRFLPDDPLLQASFSAYLGAPILSPDGELRGVLAVYDQRRRGWRSDEIEALEAFANSATVALHNALLYQRVAQEKEKSEAIIASIADGVVVVNADGRIQAWNRAAAAMTGISARAALRRKLPDLLRAELGDLNATAAARLRDAEQEGSSVELRLNRGEREIWLSVRAAKLRDPVEDRVGTVYALRDVSEERQLDQLKSDFVATVSHELRTPLTSIYGFASTLLRSDVSFGEDDRRTFLSYIASESERLTRLVDGLLSVTRLEAGGVELDLQEVDISDVLREIVVRQSERVRETHRIELALPTDPLVAAADRDKLRQIVLNLVDNAIKYSPDGGVISVGGERRLDMVEIRVSDQGIGISAADQRNLFRKFFRADARMTRGIRGIGLGLYLTRGFVTAMGGRIRVESTQGQGSTFIVDLPLPRGAGGRDRSAA